LHPRLLPPDPDDDSASCPCPSYCCCGGGASRPEVDASLCPSARARAHPRRRGSAPSAVDAAASVGEGGAGESEGVRERERGREPERGVVGKDGVPCRAARPALVGRRARGGFDRCGRPAAARASRGGAGPKFGGLMADDASRVPPGRDPTPTKTGFVGPDGLSRDERAQMEPTSAMVLWASKLLD